MIKKAILVIIAFIFVDGVVLGVLISRQPDELSVTRTATF